LIWKSGTKNRVCFRKKECVKNGAFTLFCTSQGCNQAFTQAKESCFLPLILKWVGLGLAHFGQHHHFKWLQA
jgi:hypothetical protein